MRLLLIAALAHLAFSESLLAGRPIILSEIEACAGAELVVIASLSDPEELPEDDPFGDSEWSKFGFTHFAEAEVTQVLLGTAPKDLRVYGGKMAAGTDYRLEKGSFLILLTKVKDEGYRAVDWHYSFVPIKDGKVGWLIDRSTEKREWISPEEALRRINANKLKGKETDDGE